MSSRSAPLAAPIRDAEKDLLLRMMPFRCNVQTMGLAALSIPGWGHPQGIFQTQVWAAIRVAPLRSAIVKYVQLSYFYVNFP